MKLQHLAAFAALTLGMSGCGNHWVLRKDAPKQTRLERKLERPERVSPNEDTRAIGDVTVVEKRDGEGLADYINATTIIVAKASERDRVKSLLSAVFPDVMGEPAPKPEKKRRRNPDDLLYRLEELPRLPQIGSVDAPRVRTVDEYLADLRSGFASNKAAYEATHPGAEYFVKDEFDYAAERRRLTALLKGRRAVVLRYVHVQTARRGR